jgi:L,D-transpeptidase YcbB
MRLMSCIAFALFLGATSLSAYAAEPDSPDALIGQGDVIRSAIQDRLSAKFTNATEARKSEQGALVEYYSVTDNRLLWVDEHGLNERAKSVMEEIGKADDYGLRPADYSLPKSPSAEESTDAKWLADAEIKISFAVLDYAHDARGGRIDPERLDPNLDPTLALPDPMEVLESISFRSDPAAYLRSFQPDQPQFEALRQALIAARGGNPDKDIVKIPDGPMLKLGVDHEQVALLRQRLNVPASDGKDTVFDAPLYAAVQRFQEDHGVLPDGSVGAGTRRLLNQQHQQAANPSKARLILLNMERWRWLPHDLGSFYVNVNIPEFLVRVVSDGKAIHTARVVVGKPDKQTPILSNEMQEIVFNPYWNVPNSIKTEEIRPFLTEEGGWFGGGGGWNTAVLERHNLRVNIGGREVDPAQIDWNRVDIRSLNIYQPPGPDNVLGNLKFVFPNKHDVYMHDTTQKNLFAKTIRAESHGCMRVQNPDQLALTLLKQDQGWTAGRVAAAIQGGPDQHIALREKIPVYITYFTAWVNDDGSISTFGDIYGHDARMAAALRL